MPMQASEFLAVLKSLPADRLLTATHVAALLETLSPISPLATRQHGRDTLVDTDVLRAPDG